MIKILSNLRIFQTKKCIGLSLFKTGDDTYNVDYIELDKQKSSIHISNKKNFIDSLKNIVENLPKGVPVLISLDGKGVLHKTTSSSTKSNKELINSVFPNIKVSDFYYQIIDLDKNSSFVSLVRKSMVDDLIKVTSGQGIFPISLNLGPVGVNKILPVLNSGDKLEIPNYQLGIFDGKISSIQRVDEAAVINNQNFTIDTEQISSSLLLPFSTAFSFFTNSYKDYGLSIEIVKKSQEDYKYFHLFKNSSRFFLGFLLATLLLNFILFSHYNDKFNNSSGKYALQKENISKLDTLTKKLESKEKVIKEKMLFHRSRFSYYCDRIAVLIPEEVLLNELYLQPLKAEIEDNKIIEFELFKIIIKGNANSSIVLGEWISKLKQEPWANKVIMKDYAYDNSRKMANFNIEIDLQND